MNPLCRRSPFLEPQQFDLEPYRWVMCFWPYLMCSDDSLSHFQVAFFWSKDNLPSNFEGCRSTVVRETGSLSSLCICDAPQSICAPVSKFGFYIIWGMLTSGVFAVVFAWFRTLWNCMALDAEPLSLLYVRRCASIRRVWHIWHVLESLIHL